MIKFIFIALTIFLCSLSGGRCLAADISAKTGLSYDWWDSDGENNGSQLTIPVEADLVSDDFSCRLLSGYTSTQSDNGITDGSLSALLDTKLNFSYQWLDNLPVDILVGLDFNLPTGKTDLDAAEIAMIVDPEMVSISYFGEGFNVNPTLVIAKSWGNIAGGVGLGYAWRGEYDFSTNLQDYDPGDILTFTGELRYELSADWKLKSYVEYATFGKDKNTSGAFHENGDLIVAGLGAHGKKGAWTIFSDIHTVLKNKPKMQLGTQRVLTESEKSNGNELAISFGVGHPCPLSKATRLTAVTSVLLIKANDYAETSALYIGNKEKFSLKMGAVRELRPNLEAVVNLDFFYLKSKKDWWFQAGEEDLTIKGVAAFIGIQSRF